MSQEFTEYHLQLATFNQTRRLWCEIYLEIARPPEQKELDLMREVLKMNLVSHLKRTEIKGQELFRAALLEDGNAETVRRQIVHALKAGKTVVNSTLDVGGVCFWIPAIRLEKDTGVLKVQAFAGNPLAESSLHRTFENSSRVLGSALKEFADSEEWVLRWESMLRCSNGSRSGTRPHNRPKFVLLNMEIVSLLAGTFLGMPGDG